MTALFTALPANACAVHPPLSVEVLESGERWEHYGDRPDCLYFRSTTADNVFHKYDLESAEGVRVLEHALDMSRLLVTFRPARRPDHAASYTRFIDPLRQSLVYEIRYVDGDPTPEGVTRMVVNLEPQARIDVTADTTVTIMGTKVAHIALELDPARAVVPGLREVYQDLTTRVMRIAGPNEFGRTLADSFENFVLTDDPRYEPCRVLTMLAIQTVLDMERSLYLAYPHTAACWAAEAAASISDGGEQSAIASAPSSLTAAVAAASPAPQIVVLPADHRVRAMATALFASLDSMKAPPLATAAPA